MEFDPVLLGKLKGMDEESLRNLVLRIASAAGMDPAQTQGLLSDPAVLKNALCGLTPEQAKEMLAQVGNDRAGKIADLLGKEF